jgi:hypothetical protein
MRRVFGAFLRACASQLHPKMLALLVLPIGVAVAFWLLVALFVWDPLVGFLRVEFFEASGPIGALFQWVASFGLESLRGFAVAMTALMLLMPLMVALAMAVVAVVSMPAVIRHLGRGVYRDLEWRGGWSVLGAIWNALWSSLVFLLGYLVTLPLWLIPPLAMVVPWLWWGWFTARVMRFDSLSEHADPDELRALLRAHRSQYLLLGLLVAALNYVPLMFLVTPVLSALAFAHLSLSLLRDHRGRPGGVGTVVDPAPGPGTN